MAIIYTYPTKASPANDDLILISDSADSNKTKQVKVSSLPGGSSSGVSSFNTLTGAVTITGGTNVTLSTVGNNIEINAASGGVTPAVPTNSVQFNNAGAFGGSANLIFNTNVLTVEHTAVIKGQGTGNPAGKLKLNCEFNTHALTLEGPAHASGADYTLKFPSAAPGSTQILQSDNAGQLSWITTPSGGGGGVSQVAVGGVLGTSSGAPLVITPSTGNVVVTSQAYAGASNVGHVTAGGSNITFLRGDGTWVTPTNTTYGIMGSGNSYAAGLVLAGSETHSGQYFRKDGTWVTPTNTQYTGSSGITLTGTQFTNSDKGSSQSIFKNIAVSGQSTVVADSNNDTLNLIAGSNITLTTNAASDSITINSSGGGGGVSETSGIWYATLANSSGQSYASSATQAQITITTNNCQWKRIGNMIHYQFYIAGTIKGTASGYAGILQGELFLCQTATGGATSSTTYGLPINSTLGNTLVNDGFCNGSLVMTETEAPQQALTWAYPVNGGRIGRDTSYVGYVELCSLLNSGTASKLYYPNSSIVWVTNTSENARNFALGGTLSAMVTHAS